MASQKNEQYAPITSTISTGTTSTSYDLPVVPLSDPGPRTTQVPTMGGSLLIPDLQYPRQQSHLSLSPSASLNKFPGTSFSASASSSVINGVTNLTAPSVSALGFDRQHSISSQFGIPSVKPVVDDHDRLWAEIDILNETESIAQQAAVNKSFFGADHAQALGELRKAQTELVRAMAVGDKRMGLEQQYQSLWE